MDKKNTIWNTINSIGIPVIIGFCWQFIAVPQIEKIRDDGDFISKAKAETLIKEAVLEQREKQADEKTASLSWTVANALGVPREQVAPRITALIQFGEGEMEKHQEREQFWNEFEETRYISLLVKEDRLYFRWLDNDYLVRNKTNDRGQLVYYWTDADGLNHFIGFISNLE